MFKLRINYVKLRKKDLLVIVLNFFELALRYCKIFTQIKYAQKQNARPLIL